MNSYAPGAVKDYYVNACKYDAVHSNASAFNGWDIEYAQISPGYFQCTSQEVRFDGLQMLTETGNSTVNEFGAAWENSYVFGVPCQMQGEGRMNGRRWHDELAAFRGEYEIDALVPPMKLLSVVISRDVFADYFWTVERVSTQNWLTRGMLLLENIEIKTKIATTLVTLIDACNANPAMLDYPQTRSAILQTTLETLSPVIIANLSPQASAHGELSRLQIVRRAREFALNHIDEPLQIIDVCRALGVSRRALQYSFQDTLNVNPVVYLRLLRLNGARRDLLKAGEKPVLVKDVVARWGFWHLSRFSGEYRQMFNELPSETLRRALSHAGAERASPDDLVSPLNAGSA